MKVIAYYRVSTCEQGRSGLGLEAQRQTVEKFCEQNHLEIVESFNEANSGGSLIGRPTMQQVLKLAKKTKYPIVVAKGDRAFRKESDRLQVKEAGIKVINVQLGLNPDETLEAMHGFFAEHEKKLIQKRTSEALQVKVQRDKANGIEWWGVKTAQVARANGHKTQSDNATAFANKMIATITALKNSGLNLSGIAKELNNAGSKTMRGKNWSAQQVKNIIEKLA